MTASAPASAQTQDDWDTVGNLPAKFSQAWARHDGKELAKLMSSDIDFVNVGAIWLRGRDFEIYHSRILKGRFRESTNTPLEVNVRFLRPDIAAVRWSCKIEGERLADDRIGPTRYGLMTMLAEKRDGRWLITNAQNTNSGPHRSEADGLSPPMTAPRSP